MQNASQNALSLQGTYAGEYGFSLIDANTSEESLRVLGKVSLTLAAVNLQTCGSPITGELQVENYGKLEIQKGQLQCLTDPVSHQQVYTMDLSAHNARNTYRLFGRIQGQNIEEARLKITYNDPEIDIIRDFGMKLARTD